MGKNATKAAALEERAKAHAQAQGGTFLGPYVDTRTKASWRCAQGHEWLASPNTVQQGHWCRECRPTGTKGGESLMKRTADAIKPSYPEGITERILELKASGMKTADISATLGVSIDKVKSDVQRSTVRLTEEQKLALRPRLYTEAQKEQVLALRREGFSVPEIEAKTGVDEGSVRSYCSEAGVYLTSEQKLENSRRISPTIVEEAIRLRSTGMPLEEVADKVKILKSTLKSIFGKNGVTIPMAQRRANAQAGLPPNHAQHMREFYTEESAAKTRATMKRLWQDPDYITRMAKRPPSTRKITIPPDKFQEVLEQHKLSRTQEGQLQAEVELRCRCNRVFISRTFDVWYGKVGSCGCLKSVRQDEVQSYLESLGAKCRKNARDVVSTELDIAIDDRKFAVEYHGLYFHSDVYGLPWDYHHRKWQECTAAGWRLVQIFSDEWLHRREQVESRLASMLGVGLKSIGARKLEVRPITREVGEPWFDAYHIQGKAPMWGAGYGLWQNDVLVAAIVLRPLVKDSGDWELTRFAVRSGVRVAGGFSKLVQAFVNAEKPKKIVTFSDNRWSQGDVYKASGWKLDGEVRPSYWYIKGATDYRRIHKSNFRRDAIEKKLGPILEGETEAQAMKRFGYHRVWDAGLQRWVLAFT